MLIGIISFLFGGEWKGRTKCLIVGVELEVFKVSDGKSKVLGEELRGSDAESRA